MEISSRRHQAQASAFRFLYLRNFRYPFAQNMRSSPTLLRCLCRTSAPRVARALPAELIPASKRLYHTPRTSTPLRPSLALSQLRTTPYTIRHESTSANSSSPAGTSTKAPESRLERDQVPAYELTFTCKKCSTRSSHRISKQGYHHGTVLITCPGCKNRHLMSDHLKVSLSWAVDCGDSGRPN